MEQPRHDLCQAHRAHQHPSRWTNLRVNGYSYLRLSSLKDERIINNLMCIYHPRTSPRHGFVYCLVEVKERQVERPGSRPIDKALCKWSSQCIRQSVVFQTGLDDISLETRRTLLEAPDRDKKQKMYINNDNESSSEFTIFLCMATMTPC